MYQKLFVLLALGVIIAACNQQEKSKEEEEFTKEEVQKMSIIVTSTAFEAEGMIPAQYTCDGENISPPLAFDGIPDGSKSLVLISDDPDAPAGTWVHWVLYNLPPETRQLPEKMPVNEKLASGASHGVTDFGRFGYGGPCPPGGTHRYYFKVYALDTVLDLSGRVAKKDVVAAMGGHILAEGQLMGKYAKR